MNTSTHAHIHTHVRGYGYDYMHCGRRVCCLLASRQRYCWLDAELVLPCSGCKASAAAATTSRDPSRYTPGVLPAAAKWCRHVTPVSDCAGAEGAREAGQGSSSNSSHGTRQRGSRRRAPGESQFGTVVWLVFLSRKAEGALAVGPARKQHGMQETRDVRPRMPEDVCMCLCVCLCVSVCVCLCLCVYVVRRPMRMTSSQINTSSTDVRSHTRSLIHLITCMLLLLARACAALIRLPLPDSLPHLSVRPLPRRGQTEHVRRACAKVACGERVRWGCCC